MKPELLPIFTEAKAAASLPPGWPVLRLGFRPFYIGGALLAALITPLWVAMFLGQLQMATNLPPLLWHAHEMLFGFAIAIIVGFLLTAGKAWTGLATPRGGSLGALVVLWLAARIASVVGPYPLYAVLDMTLLPIVAIIMSTLLLRSRNYRNLPLCLMLVLLATANLAFHLTVSGVLNIAALSPLYAGLALVVMIECVIAGRVIPAFTMAVNPGVKLVANPWVEGLALGATGTGLVLWIVAPASELGLVVLALAGALHIKRLLGWRSRLALKRPILLVLHVAYAWIPLGLLLLAVAQIGLVSVSSGVHALAVGATGGLIIGMLTRTARGHTGRPLVPSKAEVLAYSLVMLAAVLRVVLPVLMPTWYVASIVAAAGAWSAAFVIYLWIFTPWLTSTRLDNKDG